MTITLTHDWTEERVRQLKKLWERGLTAKRIGAALGVSRSAVLGKAHRLALPARFIAAAAKPSSCERVLGTPPRGFAEREEQRLHPREPGEPSPRLRRAAPGDLSPCEVDILHLDYAHCRWPREKHGAPGGFVYCGQQRSNVSAYCADHNTIAYQPKKPPARSNLVRKS